MAAQAIVKHRHDAGLGRPPIRSQAPTAVAMRTSRLEKHHLRCECAYGRTAETWDRPPWKLGKATARRGRDRVAKQRARVYERPLNSGFHEAAAAAGLVVAEGRANRQDCQGGAVHAAGGGNSGTETTDTDSLRCA